jgi:hypothetical protein
VHSATGAVDAIEADEVQEGSALSAAAPPAAARARAAALAHRRKVA